MFVGVFGLYIVMVKFLVFLGILDQVNEGDVLLFLYLNLEKIWDVVSCFFVFILLLVIWNVVVCVENVMNVNIVEMISVFIKIFLLWFIVILFDIFLFYYV